MLEDELEEIEELEVEDADFEFGLGPESELSVFDILFVACICWLF